jgi:hypothetical protein
MFCSKCGAENPEGAKFCSKCGAGLGTSVGVSPEAESSTGLAANVAGLLCQVPCLAVYYDFRCINGGPTCPGLDSLCWLDPEYTDWNLDVHLMAYPYHSGRNWQDVEGARSGRLGREAGQSVKLVSN